MNKNTDEAALKPRDNDYEMSVMGKKVKVELKIANYATVSSAIEAHESGVKFVRLLPDGEIEDLSWFGLCECYANGYKIRVKIETEIDERQEFIERAEELIDISKIAEYSLGKMFDAGCRFPD